LKKTKRNLKKNNEKLEGKTQGIFYLGMVNIIGKNKKWGVGQFLKLCFEFLIQISSQKNETKRQNF